MDHETLQALISVYKARASSDLLTIILDEAEGPQAQAEVLELLRGLTTESLSRDNFAPARRSACQFALNAEDFALAERLGQLSELPEDKAMCARALHGLGRDQDALTLYRQAIAEDPAIRNRDFERILGIRPQANLTAPQAKVISLRTYAKRENRSNDDRRDAQADAFLDEFDEGAITFADVAGLDEVKAEIRRRIVLPYLKPSLFERFKQKAGGNILLYGPPGCGKTLIARATAGESDARFLAVNPDDIADKYAGEVEKRLRVFFDEARSDTPAILLFDDFEIFASGQKRNLGSPALASTLLSELDGSLRDNSGILVLAATNKPWMLDPAFLRAGRFHRTFFVNPPDPEARKQILTSAFRGVPGADKLLMDRLIRRSAGLSCADLKALVEWACALTLSKTLAGAVNSEVTTALVEDGLRRLAPSTVEWIRRARYQIKAHEQDDSGWRRFSALHS